MTPAQLFHRHRTEPLTSKEKARIRLYYAAGRSVRSLARTYRIADSTVKEVVRKAK